MRRLLEGVNYLHSVGVDLNYIIFNFRSFTEILNLTI